MIETAFWELGGGRRLVDVVLSKTKLVSVMVEVVCQPTFVDGLAFIQRSGNFVASYLTTKAAAISPFEELMRWQADKDERLCEENVSYKSASGYRVLQY